MKPRILLYHVSESKKAQLQKAAAPMGIQVCEIAKEDVYQKIGYLAGEDGFIRTEDPAEELQQEVESGELMVMCGLSKLQFELLMGLFQRKKLSPIPVKAMMTPTNRDWPFSKMAREIWNEHRMMTAKRS